MSSGHCSLKQMLHIWDGPGARAKIKNNIKSNWFSLKKKYWFHKALGIFLNSKFPELYKL